MGNFSLLPQPHYFCYFYCEKILLVAVGGKKHGQGGQAALTPQLKQNPTPSPWLSGPASRRRSPDLQGREKDKTGLQSWGGGWGTHHVMLEDSLDHGREHFDDHHGPGPLSAVLGRQNDTVGAEPAARSQGPAAWHVAPGRAQGRGAQYQSPCSLSTGTQLLFFSFFFPCRKKSG